MSMYSVLMVDDEEDVVRAMQKKIDWESIGFRIMGYAHNGIEALDLAEQEAPDVVPIWTGWNWRTTLRSCIRQ